MSFGCTSRFIVRMYSAQIHPFEVYLIRRQTAKHHDSTGQPHSHPGTAYITQSKYHQANFISLHHTQTQASGEAKKSAQKHNFSDFHIRMLLFGHQ